MLSRRQLLSSMLVAAAAPMSAAAARNGDRFGPLLPDPGALLDLPKGFRYSVIANAGDEMADGLLVPPRADGMAAFSADEGRVKLVCNHENHPSSGGAFGPGNKRLEALDPALLYDRGAGVTPGTGGTTTITYDPATGESLEQRMSLAGTEINCAGGPTPWGSWLSCEECFESPGTSFQRARVIRREQRHGYVFEVNVNRPERSVATPLTGLGRFEHEAAAVDPANGIVYLSEDKHRSLLYRFLPDVPGRLAEGGRLQALAISESPSFDTRNWARPDALQIGDWHDVSWIDLEDPDPDSNELRLAGFEAGAARFARGEGLTFADDSLFMTATIGGPDRLGQIFEYRPYRRPVPGREGRLRLLVESRRDSQLKNADNLTMAPWGDLVVCEDTSGHCGLVGVTRDGAQYPIAENAYSNSELAGICFAPDGRTMFVNIQHDGRTLAITGPW